MAPSEPEVKGDVTVPSDKDNVAPSIKSQNDGEAEITTGKGLDDDVVDDAAKYLANTAVSRFPPLTPEGEKKLRRKIDAWMIPLVRQQSISKVLN